MVSKGETLIDQIVGLEKFKARPSFPSIVVGTMDSIRPDRMLRENIEILQMVEALQLAEFGV
jgi:hypothetical protein